MTNEKIEKIYRDKGFQRYTENTLTDLYELKKELDMINKEGLSFDEQEYEIGLRNVAAPVMDSVGKVIAAVGVLGPTVRLSRQRMREVVPMVKDCSQRISKALGYNRQ